MALPEAARRMRPGSEAAGPEAPEPGAGGAATTPLDGRDLVWAGSITLTAFVVRWLFLRSLAGYPWLADPQVDERVHHLWASAFARGEGFAPPPFFRAPLYPWFLGTVYRLFGADVETARLVQALLGSLNCALLYGVGRLAFRRPVAAAAGLAAALYWVLAYFDVALLIPVLATTFHLALLGAALWARRRPSAVRWAACGLLLGAAAITRPNVLLFAPPLALWVAVLVWPARRRALGHVGVLTAATLAPILPVTLYNGMVGGDWVLIASQGGVNFHIGNNPGADGVSVATRGEVSHWDDWYVAQREQAERAVGRPLKPSEVSRWYAREAWSFLVGQPSRSVPLLGRKLLYFWSHWEIPNNQDPHFVAEEYAPWVRFLPLGFWIVGPLGSLGLLLAVARSRELFPLWGFVAAYTLSVVAFFVTARFRLPVVPVLILLSCFAVQWIVSRLRQRRVWALAGAALWLAGMGFVAAQRPPVDVHGILPRRTLGLYLLRAGRATEAETMLAETIQRASALGRAADPTTWSALGAARLRQDRLAPARKAFEQSIRLDPRHGPGHAGMAEILVRRGRAPDARPHLLAALRASPTYAPACAALAHRLAEGGRGAAAEAFAREALAIAPESPELAQALAELAERR